MLTPEPKFPPKFSASDGFLMTEVPSNFPFYATLVDTNVPLSFGVYFAIVRYAGIFGRRTFIHPIGDLGMSIASVASEELNRREDNSKSLAKVYHFF